MPEDTIRAIIHNYTKEAGVRSLEREIATVCRKIAREYLGNKGLRSWKVNPKRLAKYLGPLRFRSRGQEVQDEIGLVNGLAALVGGAP